MWTDQDVKAIRVLAASKRRKRLSPYGKMRQETLKEISGARKRRAVNAPGRRWTAICPIFGASLKLRYVVAVIEPDRSKYEQGLSNLHGRIKQG